MRHLFVYGSLLFPEVLEGLCAQKFESSFAELSGFKRHAILGVDYPAIVKNYDSKVKGKIVFNVDDKSLEIITFFEGDEYEILPVIVHLENEQLEAFAFVWKMNADYLKIADWDKNIFELESLKIYIDEVVPETVNEFNQIDG